MRRVQPEQVSARMEQTSLKPTLAAYASPLKGKYRSNSKGSIKKDKALCPKQANDVQILEDLPDTAAVAGTVLQVDQPRRQHVTPQHYHNTDIFADKAHNDGSKDKFKIKRQSSVWFAGWGRHTFAGVSKGTLTSASLGMCAPPASAMLQQQEDDAASQESQGVANLTNTIELSHSDTYSTGNVLNKIRGRLKLRSMANSWRRKANNQALPALRPFIPRLLREEMMEMAKWYGMATDFPLLCLDMANGRTVMALRGEEKIENVQFCTSPYTPDSDHVEWHTSNAFVYRQLFEQRKALVPSRATFLGAVMVTDITGFTKLTELLSKRGSTGVELLTNCINNYFGKVIDVVHTYGGDVVKFAGDAMIIAFYPPRDQPSTASFQTAVLRCAQCAIELASDLGHMQMLPDGDVCQVQEHDSDTEYVCDLPGPLEVQVEEQSQVNSALLKSRGVASMDAYRSAISARLFPKVRQSFDARNGSLRRAQVFSFTQGVSKGSIHGLSGSSKLSSIRRTQSEAHPSIYRDSAFLPEDAIPDMRETFAKEQRLQAMNLFVESVSTSASQYDVSLMPQGNSAFEPDINIIQEDSELSDAGQSPLPVAEAMEYEHGEQATSKAKLKGFFHIFKIVPMSRHEDGTGSQLPKGTPAANVFGTIRSEKVVSYNRHRLSLKVICGAGSVCVYHCGGQLPQVAGQPFEVNEKVARWEFFLGDSAFAPEIDENNHRQTMAQIAGIEEHASPGDVIISHEMLQAIGLSNVQADVLLGGAVRLHAMRLPPEQAASLKVDPPDGPQQWPSHVAARAAVLFRMHVVDNIRQRIEAGQYDFLNEIRHLTVLFMGFPSLSEPNDELAHRLGPVQETVMTISQVMHQLNGSFVQFRCDEKGFLGICAFGLPGSSHTNNAERGVLAALKMQEVVEGNGHKLACGITSGNLLCACVGSKLRSEYTMFGDAINLSARLMCKAKAGLGTLLTDETTREKAEGWAIFSALQPLQLKGKAQPAKVFAISPTPGLDLETLVKQACSIHPTSTQRRSHAVAHKHIGRKEVLEVIQEEANKVMHTKKSVFIVIKGAAGFGKSRLLQHLFQEKHLLMGQGGYCNIFRASGTKEFRPIPFTPWKAILIAMFTFARNSWLHAHTTPQAWPDEKYHAYQRYILRWTTKWPATREMLARHLNIDEGIMPSTIADLSSRCDSSAEHRKDTFMSLMSFSVQDRSEACAIQEIQGCDPPRNCLQRSLSEQMMDSRKSSSANGSKSADALDMKAPDTGADAVVVKTRSSMPSEVLKSTKKSIAWAKDLAEDSYDANSSIVSRSINGLSNRISSSSACSSAKDEALKRNEMQIGPTQKELMLRSWNFHKANKRSFTTSHGKSLDKTPDLLNSKLQTIVLALISAFIAACALVLLAYGPVVLLLDDLQYFDTASWEVLSQACEELLQGVLIVATLHEGTGVLNSSHNQAEEKQFMHAKVKFALESILDTPGCIAMELAPFTTSEVSEMLHMLIPGVDIHASNVDLVKQKTQGHPVHVEQIAYFVESMGSSVQSKLAQPGGLISSDLQKISASSMSHVIVSRVDWLRPTEQLTLKVCSVLGPTVSMKLLICTYPLASDSEEELQKRLLEDVGILCRENFLQVENGHSELWRWHSTVARDVIYGIIPFNQRRLLHSRLAAALNNIVQENCNIAPRSHIAYHWTKSCENAEVVEWQRTLRALSCWKQAAAEMDAKGAYLDAVRFMTKALELSRILLVALHKGDLKDPAVVEECLKSVNTLEVAHHHTFNANTYFKMIHTDLGVAQKETYTESCFRNCLLALSFVYMPMPGMPRSGLPVWLACLGSCFPCTGGFAGSQRDLFRTSLNSRATRSGALSLSSHVSLPSSGGSMFTLETAITDPFAHAVFTHTHTAEEASLALTLCELLFAACCESNPPDTDLMEYTRQAIEWLLQSTHQVDSTIATGLLQAIEDCLKQSPSSMMKRRSPALLSVMESGLSMSDSIGSMPRPVSTRLSFQDMALNKQLRS